MKSLNVIVDDTHLDPESATNKSLLSVKSPSLSSRNAKGSWKHDSVKSLLYDQEVPDSCKIGKYDYMQ